MTTQIPASPTPQAGGNVQIMQHTNTPQPLQQNLYMMPVPQQGHTAPLNRSVPGVQCLSISTIVIGGVVVILGIIAIVLQSFNSYIANPIWTGLLFFVTTGILGICVHKKRNNRCMNIAFLVMSIISAIFAFQLMECAWNFAGAEWRDGCHPGPGQWHYCRFPFVARVAVGVVIGFCALAGLVLCIVSCSVTLYGTFTCCYNCCKCCRNGSQSSTMQVQYSNYSGLVMTPVAGNGMQVMSTSHMMPQNMSNMQQQQAGSKPMLIVATPPQAYIQNSPPAYASSPETFVVASAQPVSNPAPQSPSGNMPTTITEDNTPMVGAPNATAPSLVSSSSGGQVANNPENWQQF